MWRIVIVAVALCVTGVPASAETTRKEFGPWTAICRGTIGPSNCAILREHNASVRSQEWARVFIDFDAAGKPQAVISVPPHATGGKIFIQVGNANTETLPKRCHPDRCESPLLNAAWIATVTRTKSLWVQYSGDRGTIYGFVFPVESLERAIEYVLGEKA